HGTASLAKSNAAKNPPVRWVDGNTERAECLQRLGHETLAACLIDGRPCRIGHHDTKSPSRRGNSSRESGRSIAGYEHIGLVDSVGHSRFVCEATTGLHDSTVIAKAGLRKCLLQLSKFIS